MREPSLDRAGGIKLSRLFFWTPDARNSVRMNIYDAVAKFKIPFRGESRTSPGGAAF